MKIYNTNKDQYELSDKGNKELLKWEIKKRYAKQGIGLSPNHAGKYSLTSLSIGQMIEFLDEHNVDIHTCRKLPGNARYIRRKHFDKEEVNGRTEYEEVWSKSDGLCDALWEAVKSILEK